MMLPVFNTSRSNLHDTETVYPQVHYIDTFADCDCVLESLGKLAVGKALSEDIVVFRGQFQKRWVWTSTVTECRVLRDKASALFHDYEARCILF